jgi:hypothetical protein
MGRRSHFARRPQDDYATPWEAVLPLLPWLAPRTRFVEPCLGTGALVRHLERAGHICVDSFDLPTDARSARYDVTAETIFCTNPPWSRAALHDIIVNLSNQAPTWLLVDYNWAATQQSIPFLPRLRMMAVIGRVRWIPNSPYDGKDDACWLLFEHPSAWAQTRFIGRQPRETASALLRAAE